MTSGNPTAPDSALDPSVRMGAATVPEVRLNLGDDSAETRGRAASRAWQGIAAALVDGSEKIDDRQPFAVLGGPGTGKTSLLTDAVVNFLRRGGSADQVLFITPSKESAAAVKEGLFRELRSDQGYAAAGAPVRSVHSWAFAVLRAIRQRRDEALPRLITGAEHDAEIRTFLEGDATDGRTYWPERVRPALTMVGFARQLRDVVLRATERGVTAGELTQLGRDYDKDMWTAAGEFLTEFQQAQRLSLSDNVNASELLHSTLNALRNHPEAQEILREIKGKLRLIVIDDAHNLDPAAAEFLEAFMQEGTRTILAGDPDQCVFHFRGADEAFLQRHARDSDRRIVLSTSRRLPSSVSEAVNALTNNLPSAGLRIPLLTAKDADEDRIRQIIADTRTAEKLHIANAVRRAHLEDGVPWEDIAVIVRSVGDIPALRRTLLSHNVPIHVDSTSVVLAEQPLVSVLLLACEAAYRPLSTSELERLMESTVGGADPVMVRRVNRALARAIASARVAGRELPVTSTGTPFRASDCLASILNGSATAEQREQWLSFFGPRELDVLDRVERVLVAGREALHAHESAEMVLWKVWQATELATQLQTRALRGGTAGSQADQDLDAVMSLFDFAGDFVERQPQATVHSFVSHVREQELPTGGRSRRGVRPGAVEILPAHAAAGQEWDTVIVAGVQEDSWPAGPTVGGLFSQLELVDLLDRDIEPGTKVSRLAEATLEERRLFLLAISRARRRTWVTATHNVSTEGDLASRFLEEIASVSTREEIEGAEGMDATESHPGIPRVLALEPLLAELRATVVDPDQHTEIREAAARNLAVMAREGVFGADPAHWWGMLEPSTDEPVVGRDGEVRLSPSKVERIEECALHFFFDQHRGAAESTEALSMGTAIHAIAEALIAGLSEEDALAAVRIVIAHVIQGSHWRQPAQVEKWEKAVRKLYKWLEKQHLLAATAQETASDGTRRAQTEVQLTAEIGHTDSGVQVRLSGRSDLLIHDESGETRIVDFKTGSSALSKADAQESMQLRAYQFLLSLQPDTNPGGAELVYVGTTAKSAAVRPQDPLTDEQAEEFRADVMRLAGIAAGPHFLATPGTWCERCDFQSSCPAVSAGRSVVQ